jgi:hypothetical protein
MSYLGVIATGFWLARVWARRGAGDPPPPPPGRPGPRGGPPPPPPQAQARPLGGPRPACLPTHCPGVLSSDASSLVGGRGGKRRQISPVPRKHIWHLAKSRSVRYTHATHPEPCAKCDAVCLKKKGGNGGPPPSDKRAQGPGEVARGFVPGLGRRSQHCPTRRVTQHHDGTNNMQSPKSTENTPKYTQLGVFDRSLLRATSSGSTATW